MDAASEVSEAPSGRHPSRGARVTWILGEVIVTVGVIVVLYFGWQLWIGDVIYGAQRSAAGQEIAQEWAQSGTPEGSPSATPDPATTQTPAAEAAPIVMPEAADGEVFGVMHIPRFGADYQVPMAGGVSRERTLDPIGIGHYPGTPMPGAVGNFAVAAHRTTYGAPFHRIAELQLNDAIVVETADGWYTYRFRTLEYVTPNEVDVLLPVPQVERVAPKSRYITLTSCSPMFAMTERIVAFGVFDSFTPRASGPPPSLTEGLAA